MNSSLSPRLALCADFVRKNAKVADIGTDHAYLPVFLANKGIITSALAADVNSLPLKKGSENIRKNGLEDKIKTRLSNGFESINADEFDDAIIAGMGGDLICRIIESAGTKLTSNEKQLILQPMTRANVLRAFLYKNKFSIIKESAVVSEGRVYTVILARYSGIDAEYLVVDEYIGKLDFSIESDRLYIKGVLKGLNVKLNDKASSAETSAIIKEIRTVCNDQDL